MLTPTDIRDFINEREGVDLSSKRRLANLTDLRTMYVKLCFEFVNDKYLSLVRVASPIERDHATVMYHKRRFNNFYNLEFAFTKKYVELHAELAEIKTPDLDNLSKEELIDIIKSGSGYHF